MQTHRVLCPVDLFDHSRVVLRYARAIAAENGGHVVLLTVMEPILQASALVNELDILEHDLRADLEKLIDEVPATATRPECRLRKGRPHTEIIAASLEEDCDLIVMGTHGRRGVVKAFLGSTLERVLRDTIVPVLAIPPHVTQVLSSSDPERLAIRHVLVGIDFARASIEAARVAAALAQQHGATLRLLHVIPLPPSWGRHPAMREVYDRGIACADRELRVLAEELRSQHVSTTSCVVPGEPEEVIVGQAGEEPGTLVVLGLREPGSAGGARPGSIAYRVLSLSKAPTLVVPVATA